MTELPIATVERIIRSAGINRISSSATLAIIPQAEKFIKDLSMKSYGYTQHAGRNTLQEIDVVAALNETH